MDTQYRKNLKSVLTASKDYTDNSIEKLKWELGTYDLSVTTDSTVAYTKTIPTNTIKGRLNYIGGASKVSDNLIVLNDVAETTTNGITYKVENGVITLNGTATQQTKFAFEFINAIPKNKDYYVLLFISGTTTATNPKAIGETTTDVRLLIPSTTTFNVDYDIKYLWFSAGNGTVWTNYVIKPMIVKGSTAPTEFKVGFENIRSAKTTSVVVSGTDVAPITKAIPSEIQALEGYGQSNPEDSTKFNYIDFDKKIYLEFGYIDENDEWQELATPVETDISQYIDDDFKNIDTTNMTTATFENEFGYDVPSEIDYLIEEVKA